MELQQIFEKLAEVEPEWFSFSGHPDDPNYRSCAVMGKISFTRSQQSSWRLVWDTEMRFFDQAAFLLTCIDVAVSRGWETFAICSQRRPSRFGIEKPIISDGSMLRIGEATHEVLAIAAALALLQARGVEI